MLRAKRGFPHNCFGAKYILYSHKDPLRMQPWLRVEKSETWKSSLHTHGEILLDAAKENSRSCTENDSSSKSKSKSDYH